VGVVEFGVGVVGPSSLCVVICVLCVWPVCVGLELEIGHCI